MVDFASTPDAVANRKAKATALAYHLRSRGITAGAAADLAKLEGTSWLRRTEKDAGIPKSSDATWTLALTDLARQPPVLVTERRPGCTCRPDPQTGVLYEFPGWYCPHGSKDHPAPGYVELHAMGRTEPTDLLPGPPPPPVVVTDDDAAPGPPGLPTTTWWQI
jgi:hypothetical protein